MGERRSGGIVAAVTLAVVAAYVTIMVLFLTQSVGIASRYAERMTDIISSELGSDLVLYADQKVEPITPDLLASDLESVMHRLMDESDAEETALLFSEDGTIIISTDEVARQGQNVFELFPQINNLRDELAPEGSTHVRVWEGLEGVGAMMPHDQRLLDVGYCEGIDSYLLVTNTAQTVFDAMRRTTTTLVFALSVVMTLLILLVMSIVRWYRSRLIKVATTDELTGLANRKSFVSSFEERAAGRDADKLVTMALIDVDKFKHINDGYGHAAGDHALAGVAAQIATLAGPDGLAGRWGGDEFIAVVDATGEEARERIESMIDRVSSLVFEEGFDVSVSVGATTAAWSIGIERMVEQADDALYQTKEGGRGFLTEYVPGVTPHMAGEKAARAQGDVAREEAPSRSSAVVQSPNVPVRQKLVDLVVGSFMEAVNKMIPFVAGGGILIAIAFLIDGASVDINALSAEARVNFGSITPIAAGLKDVGSAAFNFMLPIFAAFLARSLSGDEAFMAGFAGGYLSSQGSAGFAGAICAAFVAAIVVRMMCGLVGDTSKGVQHVAPVLLYPVFSLLIMYLLMSVVIDPLASGFDAVLTSVLTSLEGGNRVVLGTACGAMMATDMGGPINKAAYHFGTAAIASGKPEIMASVMVGGMVPPCGLALCMLLFRKKFSVSERDRGPATMVMGLSFITEGAIPFLLTDPFRVIPSCMLGSGVAGALSMAFGCTLMAPHGGIFVFPVVGNAGMYLLALGLGSIATAVVLGLLKHAEAGE